MMRSILQPGLVARGILVITVACLYAGAVLINNQLLFPWLEFDNFRHLLFLPAGLKLFLVMLLGWHAVLGIGLGLTAVALSEFAHLGMWQALCFGMAAALSTKLTLALITHLLRVSYPWTGLNWRSLCSIALTVGCMDAITVQVAMVALGYETWDDLMTDTLQGTFGRVAGTFIFLAVSLQARRHLGQPPQA